MKELFIFLILSIPIFLISRNSLKTKGGHGIYRFFAWEAMLLLLVFRIEFWFQNPFSWYQLLSWFLLFVSVWLVTAGVITLKRNGKQQNVPHKENLYNFEKTTELVKSGIYRYIRHPMYSSLLFLNWGIYFKKPDLIFWGVALLASLLLYLTARADEKECTRFFGEPYREYMKTTKRFIPFVF